jgi:hypothetical protein
VAIAHRIARRPSKPQLPRAKTSAIFETRYELDIRKYINEKCDERMRLLFGLTVGDYQISDRYIEKYEDLIRDFIRDHLVHDVAEAERLLGIGQDSDWEVVAYESITDRNNIGIDVRLDSSNCLGKNSYLSHVNLSNLTTDKLRELTDITAKYDQINLSSSNVAVGRIKIKDGDSLYKVSLSGLFVLMYVRIFDSTIYCDGNIGKYRPSRSTTDTFKHVPFYLPVVVRYKNFTFGDEA